MNHMPLLYALCMLFHVRSKRYNTGSKGKISNSCIHKYLFRTYEWQRKYAVSTKNWHIGVSSFNFFKNVVQIETYFHIGPFFNCRLIRFRPQSIKLSNFHRWQYLHSKGNISKSLLIFRNFFLWKFSNVCF